MEGFSVFAYGSLMWRPGFPYASSAAATTVGRHRRLCVYSWHHRGTPERPGLVLGLDRGGACRGMIYRVRPADADAVLAYLRAREQITNVYIETSIAVRLADGSAERALAYVVNRAHRQYAGELPRDRILAIVADACGVSGQNADYVTATADHLADVGIHDPTLDWLAARLREGGARTPAPALTSRR